MANGLVDPPSNDLGLSAGNDSKGGTGGKNKNRNLMLGAAAIGGLALIYLYAKSKSAASSSTTSSTATPYVIAPANNQDTYLSGAITTLSNENGQILNQEIANGTGISNLSNGLSSGITGIEQAIAGSQGAIIGAINNIPQPTPAPSPAPAPAPAPSTLPSVNPAQWPTIVEYGSYSPNEFTQIGTVSNGQYNGTNVTGGVPVYANVFGGFAQGFNMSTLPSGTGIYIPTIFTGYEAK